MTAVSVFVDDAIRGDLPLVCAKTGKPTDLVIRMRKEVGGGLPGWAWFLLALGPPGFLVMLVAALVAPGPEYLTVRIPETEASFAWERHLARLRLVSLGAGAALLLYGAFRPGPFPAVWLALGAAFVVLAGVLHVAVWRQSIGVSIDVTRRWVTITGVHPAFAEAVERHQAVVPRRI